MRFGAPGGNIAVHGEQGSSPLDIQVRLRVGEAKRATVNGAALRTAEQLRLRATTLVFTPDRLAVVKGASRQSGPRGAIVRES